MKNILNFLIFIVIGSQLGFGQDNNINDENNHKASISGVVRDDETNEPLPEAYVFLNGGVHKTVCDLDGKFVFHNLEKGLYKVKASYTGFPDKEIEVNVINNELYDVVIRLSAKVEEIQTVNVKVQRTEEQEALTMRKKESGNVEIVTSEYLKKTPSTTASDAIAKSSGASIQDNKFVVVRGLNDRYNAAFLNGAPLPSSESDRKAFSFDIFPVSMIEYLSVQKTASPELSGEFAGGVIDIKTKDIPENNFQSISVGGGYNTLTTFKESVNYKGGKYDWLGIDDGGRDLPSVIPSKQDFPTLISEQASLAKEYKNDWSTTKGKYNPNFNMMYSIGLVDTLFHKEIGIIAALSYNRKNNYFTTARRSFTDVKTELSDETILETDYLDQVYSSQILAGGMFNFAIKLNNHNRVSFKNVYNINTDNRVINRSGQRDAFEENPTIVKSQALWYTQNNIYSSQLIGEHMFAKDKLRFDWVGGYSDIQRAIPNLRRMVYTKLDHFNDPNDPVIQDTMYSANIGVSSVGSDYGGGIFYSKNHEVIKSFKGAFTYKMDTINGILTEIKLGGFYQDRQREFTARQLGYTRYGGAGQAVKFDNNLLYLPQDSIFLPENMGLIKPGVGGFKLTDQTKYTDGYTASSNLKAGFISIDNRFGKKYRLLWGARVEQFNQTLEAQISKDSLLTVDTTNIDLLPSFNFIYSPNKKHNVKLAGSQTLNRPEYRELAPFAFYDFNTQFVLSGNADLKRALITNADLRYEFYPGNGQLLSGTVFYKHFQNPIEQVARPDVMNEISYQNVPEAINYGIEIEFKTFLGAIFKAEEKSFLNDISLFSNLAIIRSKVDVSQNVGVDYKYRSLQGQSPYVLNGNIAYTNKKYSTTFTINVNNVGDRIYIIGSSLQPDVWEKGRTFVDLQLSKGFFNDKLEIRLNFQNILSQKQLFYQNGYSTEEVSGGKQFVNNIFLGDKNYRNGFSEKTDNLIWSTINPKQISFSASFKF